MIDIKELRIGNLLIIENIPLGISTKEDKGIYKVISISNIINSNPCVTAKNIGCGITVGSSIKNLEPIPLTPELLKNCGFQFCLDCDTEWHMESEGLSCTISPNEEFGISFAHDGYILIGCKYLHQFQNMYYAITGEELEVNL